MNNKKNIALLGTYYTESVGDALLFECVKYLYKKNAEKYGLQTEFKIVDIFGRTSIRHRKRGIAGRIEAKFTDGEQFKAKQTAQPNIDYFKGALKDCDMAVVVGGGLFKYSVGTDFTDIFYSINAAVRNLGIPVVYNALGVEGEHEKNTEAFKKMQSAFGDEVKLISCRERFDVIKSYFGEVLPERISLVSDTGVWAKEAFSKGKSKSSNKIGINPVAPYFFNMHGRNVSENELESFWTDLILGLDNGRAYIQIFTNGNNKDYRFARKIYKAVKNRLRFRPLLKEATDPYQMISNISRCDVIIASRLHTCISAYSLGIPVIGIAWNDKLLNWAKMSHQEDLYSDLSDTSVESILNNLKDVKTSYDDKKKEQMKRSINDFAEAAVKLLVKEG